MRKKLLRNNLIIVGRHILAITAFAARTRMSGILQNRAVDPAVGAYLLFETKPSFFRGGFCASDFPCVDGPAFI